jgi:NTE family protein
MRPRHRLLTSTGVDLVEVWVMAERVGLVLGSGGLVGGAWETGALLGLRDATGLDPRDAELVVGTSAGAFMGALLARGATLDTLARHQLGMRASEDPVLDFDYAAFATIPPPASSRPGAPQLIRGVLSRRAHAPALAVLVALLPQGAGSAAALAEAIRQVSAVTGQDGWPVRPETLVVALDDTTGERHVFDGSEPAVTLEDAVLASAAVPGMFPPVRIGGHRYLDGGFGSADSADLAAGRGLDHVYVLSPLTAVPPAPVWPRTMSAQVERRVRFALATQLRRELRVLEGDGVRVDLLQPGPAEVELMGYDLMADHNRPAVLAAARRAVGSQLSVPA